MKSDQPLAAGMVVQLDPEKTKNPMFGGCMMVITEPKSFGAQGYVQALGENGGPGGQAYYRASWDEMELVGAAVWVAQ
jgi:hypothetical protein